VNVRSDQPANMDDFETLVEAIESKLRSQKDVVRRSMSYGRIVWRQKGRQIEVDLEPRI
jgi:hypothetical protein